MNLIYLRRKYYLSSLTKKISIAIIVKSAFIVIVSVFMLLPFVLMLLTSLKSYDEVNSITFVFIPEKLMFSNYIQAMQTGPWKTYFMNSLFITVTVTFLCTLFNSLAGYAFARMEFRGKNFLFGTLLIGLMIAPQVIMVPAFTIIRHIPLFGGNNIFGNGGIGWVNSYWGLIMPYIAGAYGVFLFKQFFMSFPKALDDAADIDGCSKLRTFLQIYIPASKPVIASFVVLKVTNTWNDYLWPLIVTNSDNMKTVQLALANFKNDVIEWEILMAATTVVTIPIIIVFLSAQKYFIEGSMTSGIKG